MNCNMDILSSGGRRKYLSGKEVSEKRVGGDSGEESGERDLSGVPDGGSTPSKNILLRIDLSLGKEVTVACYQQQDR